MTPLRTPLVSVVVATRDRPGPLRAAIAAIRDQDYAGELEVLVVHDRSEPDGTLASEAPGRRVRVLVNERTPGLAGARNTGILAAAGELVAFCDDDDVWRPEKLTRQVQRLAAEPSAELVTCGIEVVSGDRRTPRTLDWGHVRLADLLVARRTELHPSTFCFRREALLDGIGLVDEELPGSYAEDYELLLRTARRGPIPVLADVLVDVHWHRGSYFTAYWDTVADALGHLLDRHPEFATVPAGEARVAGQIAFAEAARGRRREALRWAARAFRRNPRERRTYLALAVSTGLLGAENVIARLNARGHGI